MTEIQAKLNKLFDPDVNWFGINPFINRRIQDNKKNFNLVFKKVRYTIK